MKLYTVSSSLSIDDEFNKMLFIKAKSHLRAAYTYADMFDFLIDDKKTNDPYSRNSKMYKITNCDQSIRYDYIKIRKIKIIR